MRIRSTKGKRKIDVPAQQSRTRAIQTFPPFWSIQTFSGVNPHWGESSALFSSYIQMLFSSRNTLTDIPRNNVSLNMWAYLDPVKMTYKINDHRFQEEIRAGRRKIQ